MNPLLKHTLDELNKPNAHTPYIIGMAFMSLLEQAKDNPNINLNGGDSVDGNTAKYTGKTSIFDDLANIEGILKCVSFCDFIYAKDKMPKLCTHIPHNFFTGWTNIFFIESLSGLRRYQTIYLTTCLTYRQSVTL